MLTNSPLSVLPVMPLGSFNFPEPVVTWSDSNTTIKLYGHYGKIQQLTASIYVCGDVIYQGQLMHLEKLRALLLPCLQSPQTLASLLGDFSGFFSIVSVTEHEVLLICDKLRSRPLFYTQQSCGRHLVSDSSRALVNDIIKPTLSLACEHEFYRSGYVTGEQTLIEEMKQVQAGSSVRLTATCMSTEPYFYFLPNNSHSTATKADLQEKLHLALVKSFNELKLVAGDRQILLPLSGGYDSRIIAVYLKLMGFTNVTCFTFGRKSSKEVTISQKVASALGFDWHFVEYNKSMWRKIKTSAEFSQYLSFIGSYVSVANVQVYPAIIRLINNGVVGKNAMVLPGHTGDFSSGGHIPATLGNQCRSERAENIIDDVAPVIIKRHFRTRSSLAYSERLISKVTDQLTDIVRFSTKQLHPATLFEAWECRERQAKFIVNSNRYYDFHQLDWWMPLWSKAFIDVWYDISLKHRVDSVLWKSFVEDKYNEVTGGDAGSAERLGNVADKYHPKIFRLRNMFDYFTDDNSLYALVPFYRWVLHRFKYKFARGTVFSYLSFKQVKQIKAEIGDKT